MKWIAIPRVSSSMCNFFLSFNINSFVSVLPFSLGGNIWSVILFVCEAFFVTSVKRSDHIGEKWNKFCS